MREMPYNIIAEKTREERQYNIKNLERLELNKNEQHAVRQVVNTINKEGFSTFIAFTIYSLLWGIGLVKAYKDISFGFAAVTVFGIGLGLYVAIKALLQIKNPSSFVYESAQYGKVENLYFFNEDSLRPKTDIKKCHRRSKVEATEAYILNPLNPHSGKWEEAPLFDKLEAEDVVKKIWKEL